MTELDIPGLLRALAEQQMALMAAHAESMRVAAGSDRAIDDHQRRGSPGRVCVERAEPYDEGDD